jgi:hypothetical protein
MGDYVTAEETMLQAVALPIVKKKIIADPQSTRRFKVLNFS